MLVTLYLYSLSDSSNFSLSALMMRSKTTARTLVCIICYSYKRYKRSPTRDSTSNSRSASTPSGPFILRVLDENFSRPFLPTLPWKTVPCPRGNSISLHDGRSFFFEGNNKSISDRRLWTVYLAEEKINTGTISLPAIIDCPWYN